MAKKLLGILLFASSVSFANENLVQVSGLSDQYSQQKNIESSFEKTLRIIQANKEEALFISLIYEEEVVQLFKALETNSAIKLLHLQDFGYFNTDHADNAVLKSFADLLDKNKTIKKIIIDNVFADLNNDNYINVGFLKNALHNNHSVEEIKLWYWNFNKDTAELFSEFVTDNNAIKNIDLVVFQMMSTSDNNETYSRIAKSVMKSNKIESFDFICILSGMPNAAPNESCKEYKVAENVASDLATNRTLKHIGLDFPFTEKAANQFIKAIKINSKLNSINLYSWSFGNSFLEKLLPVLSRKKQITEFSLWGPVSNQIRTSLLEYLVQNKNLTKFSFSRIFPLGENTPLTLEEAQKIARKLETSEKLNTLELTFDGIDDQSAFLLADALQKNKSLKTLDLTGNLYSLEATRALASSLDVNYSITNMYIDHLNYGYQDPITCPSCVLSVEEQRLFDMRLERNRDKKK